MGRQPSFFAIRPLALETGKQVPHLHLNRGGVRAAQIRAKCRNQVECFVINVMLNT